MTTSGTPESTGTGTPRSVGDSITGLISDLYNSASELASPTASAGASVGKFEQEEISSDTEQEDSNMANGVTLQQLQLILDAITKSNKKILNTVTNPRYGGTTPVGAFSGGGDPTDSSQPRSRDCYREFTDPDPRTALKLLGDIETACKKGLKDDPNGILFSSPDEKDGNLFVTVFRSVEDLFKQKGTYGRSVYCSYY